MGEKTGIGWTDHTFNPWIGCTKVSPGCDFCYAERENERRFHWVPGWGKGQERRRTSGINWLQPIYWGRAAVAAGKRKRVFCASLADVFDGEISQEWRNDLWELMGRTLTVSEGANEAGLEWMLLTKRPTNIRRMMPEKWILNPPSWLRIGVSVEDQAHDWRISKLLEVWSGPNFVSVEPMLGAVDLEPFLQFPPFTEGYKMTWGLVEWRGLDWVICGCESGPKARAMDPDWARELRDQCQAAGVPYFLKQMSIDGTPPEGGAKRVTKEPELDGRQWLEFPEAGR